MGNLEIWEKLKQPPPDVLKPIEGVRGLSGKTDINPQWRYKAMTEQFGVCGIGWKYTVVKLWLEPVNDEICAFAEISLSIKVNGEWSEAIPGSGGSKLLVQESKGPYVNDEVFKMAITDALSVAMKMIGVAADIYMGFFDGSKYASKATSKRRVESDPKGQAKELPGSNETPPPGTKAPPPLKDLGELLARAAKFGLNPVDVSKAVEVETPEEIIDMDEAWRVTAKMYAVQIRAFQDGSKERDK